jgi:hypothetical protein
MNGNEQRLEADIERLKKKYEIDEKIADKHRLTVRQVEEEFDPRFRQVLLPWLLKKWKGGP